MSKNLKKSSEKAPEEYMNPRTDYSFKRIFADPSNKHILLAMLNAYLSDYIGEIADIELMNPEQLGITKEGKRMSYDLYGKEEDKRRFIVEMQRGKLRFYVRRAVSYMSRAVSNSLQKGDLEYKIPEIVSLNLMDYNDPLIVKMNQYIQRVMLKNDENEIFYDDMMYIFVNLCIFANCKGDVSRMDEKQKWGYYLKNMEKLRMGDVSDETGIIKEFIDLCRLDNLNKKEMKEYKKSVLDYYDVQNAILCAKEDSYEEGMEAGLTEGAKNAKLEMAAVMLRNGLPISMISEVSGLSAEEIEKSIEI